MPQPLTTEQVVHAFLDAFQAQDFERASRLLSQRSFTYEGPMDRFDSADAFLRDLEKYAQIIKRIERRRLFVDGDEACAILTFVTSISDIERTRVAEWITVKDGEIVRMEGFLDVRAYARMFDADDS